MTAPETTHSSAGPILLATELSLAALSCAAGFGLIRLFADASFVPQVIAAAIVAHVLAALCRRRGVGPATTTTVALVGAIVVVSWLVLGHTTTFGIPTSDTLQIAREQLSDAWSQFGDVKAPAPTLPGFVLASCVGVWFLAFLSDAAAFRASVIVEAMVPSATLFVFGAALGAPHYRLLATVLFVVALLSYWLFARALRQLAGPSWMARDERRGTEAVVRTGAALALVGVVSTMFLGPNLPGADADAIIPWRASDREGGGSRVTVSPLVDIRTRIVDQANIEVFRVKSSTRSYCRLTSLEPFDGRIWSSSRRYRRAEGTLGSSVSEENLPTETVEQRFEITALDSIWLPAAFRPVAIDGTDARYDAESGSLLTETVSAIGSRYEVTSAVPRLDGSLLAGAPVEIPGDIAATYLALPPAFPASVTSLAGAVVNGATTPYDAAKRLQDFFRSGEFTYDLNVAPGHGEDALEQFLFATRRGYCEQFAGAYAAMARAIGLPARIGVGFTTGEETVTDTYSVRGYHGHAWPEVYLAGFGWVAFEPTPGRGIPGGEPWTGVPEAQADPGAPNTATTLATTTTTVAPGGAAGDATTPSFDLPDVEAGAGDTDAGPSPWPRRLLVAAVVLLTAPILWMSGVAVTVQLRRRRRRALARSGTDRVGVAWDEVGEALARRGVPARPSETPREFARRASSATALDPALLGGLAELTTVGRYAPPDESAFDDELVESALATARDVERRVMHGLDGRTRLKTLVDPRRPTSTGPPRRELISSRRRA